VPPSEHDYTNGQTFLQPKICGSNHRHGTAAHTVGTTEDSWALMCVTTPIKII